jgi:predicted RNase H-like HicB family nuclease
MQMPAIVGVSTRDAKPQVKFLLPVQYKQDGEWVVVLCPTLDVASQGRTHKAAHAAIIEAVSLFLETCFEMGTLGEVLRNQGFTQMQPPSGGRARAQQEMIEVPMELVAHAQTRADRPRAAR